MSSLIVLLAALQFALAEEDVEPSLVASDAEQAAPPETLDDAELNASALSIAPARRAPDPLEERLLRDAESTAAAPSASGMGNLWMWPLGLLGLVGVAGVAYRNRQVDGTSSEIRVLSRAALNNRASLAVVEVMGADGVNRRMLVGVGGGAPRLVADLSTLRAAGSAPSAVVEETPDAVSEVVEEPAAVEADPTPARQNDAPTVEAQTEDKPARGRKHGAAAYAQEQEDAERQKRLQAREDLLAQVLAEREADRDDSSSRKEAWARNFEALLGQHSGSR